MIIIIMGITGSGKTTVGKLLAENLQWPFFDADDYHTDKNVGKMKDGIPLTDADRIPWLENLGSEIVEWEQNGNAILACSALKESYRNILKTKVKNIKWVFLNGSFQTIKERVFLRQNHFMKNGMIISQLNDLEKPKYALEVNIKDSPEHIIQNIRTTFKI